MQETLHNHNGSDESIHDAGKTCSHFFFIPRSLL
jgi:hypothetical protein